MTDASPIASRLHAAPGGHLLPARFSESPTVARRTPRPGLVFGILGIVATVMVIGGLQLSANLGFDTAVEQYRESAATTASIRTTVQDENDALRSTTEAATLILESDTGALIDAASTDALNAAAAAASDATAEAEATLAADVASPPTKPTWFWELFGESAALDDDRADADALAADLRDDSADLSTASASLTDSGIAALTAAAATAAALEPAHVSARNDSVIALRRAVEDASATVSLDDASVTTFSTLQVAAAQLVESEGAELAEKAGPLLGARLEVEAFARSLAPGVLLEFDWAPIVNGYGYDGGMGGYTTWWWDEPGRAVIQLSDSVAEQWPADRSKALVVHEVGHAISVKCADMYDASTQDSIEKWATAWAISMGYTDDANGVWAYGYPPQSYIDAAAGCR